MLVLPKNKKERKHPQFVIFLVEGDSDQQALETPLSNMIYDKHPEYQVRFLQQRRLVNKKTQEELDDNEDENDVEDSEYEDDTDADEAFDDDESEDTDDDSDDEEEYELGGDITTSSYVEPKNIETKITNRFITPRTVDEGLYPKYIVKIIQIMDLDGTYLKEDRVVNYAPERADREKAYYNTETEVIETNDIEGIIDRNERKIKNTEYLLNLPEGKIKIKTKSIPYEAYFFSTNLDHFINNDANIEGGKKGLAKAFMREYGLDTETFCNYFFKDPDSVGKMGYEESWKYITEGTNSIKRLTNIDCLIRRLLEP